MSMMIQRLAATTRATPVVNRLTRLASRFYRWLSPAPVILTRRPCDESIIHGSFTGLPGEIGVDGLAAGWQNRHRQRQWRLRGCGCPT